MIDPAGLAILRLWRVNRFLLGTTALTPHPWKPLSAAAVAMRTKLQAWVTGDNAYFAGRVQPASIS